MPLKSELLVSTATALASWEYQRKTSEAEEDRVLADAKRGDASLRFVHFAGLWSQFDYGSRSSSWPLTPSLRLTELADFVEQHHRFESTPAAGDVFLLASFRGHRHVRAGIVAVVETVSVMLDGSPEFICITIEGELDAGRAASAVLQGHNARLVRRRLSPAFGDSFFRWCDLPSQAWPATLDYQVPKNLVTLDLTPRRRAA
jgi:hypothetical protein